jgi:MinD-like ATPase involved in chromosome partitioning or flagellar assembly
MSDRRAAPVIDGRPAGQGPLATLHRRGQRLMVSSAEREEAQLEQRLASHRGVSRANTVAVMSPSGGVGKTACAFLIGSVLAAKLKLRVVVVDGNPAFGTLGQLVPQARRPERGLGELLRDAGGLLTAAEVGAYVSRLPTGLHVLAARRDSEHAIRLEPDWYGELVALLTCFYEVVRLDLGPGVVGPLPRFAAQQADQIVLVTTPDWATSNAGLEALAHIRRRERTTVAINGTHADTVVDERFGDGRTVTIPYDRQLARMLETRTYSLGALGSPTRTAIKRLTLAVADRFVYNT